MSARIIKLLHVEDDPIQQRLMAHHLQALPEFAFAITTVESEDGALQLYREGQFDLVLLDYQLSQGNGLQLLRRLRQIEPILPIIAVSGIATSEVAAELVQAGADDYFDKRELTSDKLARSVRALLLRNSTVRRRTVGLAKSAGGQVEQSLFELSRVFVQRLGADLVQKLDAVENQARQDRLGAEEVEQLYQTISARLAAADGLALEAVRLLLRPLMLELLVRLLGELPEQTIEDAGQRQSSA